MNRNRHSFHGTLAAAALAIVCLAAFAPAGKQPTAAPASLAPPIVASMGPTAHSAVSTLVAEANDAAQVGMSIANYDR